MAHSIQIRGDKHEVFHDSDLLVLLHLMMAEAGRVDSVVPAADELMRSWRNICQTSGPGTLNLDLNSMAADSAKRTFVLDVLGSISASLPGQGEIPTAGFAAGWQTPDLILSSHFPVAGLHDAIAKLCSLLREKD